MWIFVNKEYYLKQNYQNEMLTIFITNFERLWLVKLSSKDIYSNVKKLNPLIEAEEKKMIEKVIHMLNLTEGVEREVNHKENILHLSIKSRLLGFKFIFKTELTIADSKMFFNEVTLPNLLLIKSLNCRESALINLLHKKDAEIEEYKAEGLEIKRSHLVTKPFSEKEFNNTNLIAENIEGFNFNFAEIFDKSVNEKLQEIDIKIKEVTKVKEEPFEINNTSEVLLQQDTIKIENSNKRIKPLYHSSNTVKKVKSNVKLGL